MSLINHTYGFIFVHIPKNGGTSVALALAPLSTYRDQEIGATELGESIAPQFRRRYGIGKHATLREIAAVVGPSTFGSYRSFCVSRHPVDRLASTFAFLKRWTRWQALPSFEAAAREFATCDTLDAFIGSEFFATPGPDRLFLPQTEWIMDASQEGIAVDRILRLEQLDTELPELLAWIGVPADRIDALDIRRTNVSSAHGRPIQLSEPSLEALYRRYAGDFELLGYSLEAPDR